MVKLINSLLLYKTVTYIFTLKLLVFLTVKTCALLKKDNNTV